MSSKTTHIGLIKQAGDEYGDNDITNENLDLIDEELNKRGKTVNGIVPDEKGNYVVNEVPFARQIVTDDSQEMSGEFLFRTTGGDASLTDGPATLVSILGRSIHTGVVAESIQMTVNAVPREEGEDPITAELDRDTFVAYVSESGTTTLSYTDAWSANPSLYGITVIGTPVAGDQIVIVYAKENRGLITHSTPNKFISTGWNLYNNSVGYARVKKYSDIYGFLIGGTYTAVQFSETLTGEKTTITPASGYFTIPSDGYIWVTGGNSTNTYVLMTWSDWTGGYEGDFKAYEESAINLATIMTNFPYGLMQVEGVSDEIDFSIGKAISRIDRMTYSAENLAIAKASGRPWEADTSYIYIVKAAEDVYTTSVSGSYTANDHGEEIIDGSTIPVFVQTLYGQNLVDKLRMDVVTKSQDLVNNLTSDATNKALTAKQGKTLNDAIANIATVISGTTNNSGHAISAGEYFIANGAKYKASATIDTNATWSDKSTSVSDHDLINALNSKIVPQEVTITAESNITIIDSTSVVKSAGIYICNVVFTTSANISSLSGIFSLPSIVGRSASGVIFNRTDETIVGFAYLSSAESTVKTFNSLQSGKTYRLAMTV